jgi:hypothetical protein
MSSFATLILTGTSGNDRIVGNGNYSTYNNGQDIAGSDGDDTLDVGDGGTAWNYLSGNNGNDTYLYHQKSGLVFINSIGENATSGTSDKLIFTDLNLSDLAIDYFDFGAGTADGKAIGLRWTQQKNSVLWIANEAKYIESFQFGDGSTATGFVLDPTGHVSITATHRDPTASWSTQKITYAVGGQSIQNIETTHFDRTRSASEFTTDPAQWFVNQTKWYDAAGKLTEWTGLRSNGNSWDY